MKKIISNIYVLLTALTLCFVACERNEEVAVATLTITSETVETSYPTATITCALLTDATVEAVTVQLSQTPDFEQYQSQAMTLQEDGTYSTLFTDLPEEVLYYIRYEVSNRYTSAYVTQLKTLFLTSKPEVITSEPEHISMFSAIVGGEVIKDNGFAITTRGVCYSTEENPTVDDTKVERSPNIGQFNCELTNLQSNTVYYVRAFASNANGTAYGQQVTFTTKSAPAVYTDEPNPSYITAHSAVVSGGYTSDGGEAITDCGICYSFSPNPTISDTVVTQTVNTDFTCTLSDLRPNTTYYARAYVTNKNGTAYGNEITFTTTTGKPIVTTQDAQAISATSILAKGAVISDGGFTVVKRGLCYNTTPEPNISNHIAACGSGIGEFAGTLAGLQAGTTYYVRAYATNSEGTSYGEPITVQL